jgi:hypothetical protein
MRMSGALSRIASARRAYSYRWCDAVQGFGRDDPAWDVWLEMVGLCAGVGDGPFEELREANERRVGGVGGVS